MTSYRKDEIGDLIDGKLEWSRARSIISAPKDDDRFDKYLEILQERVQWNERILLPLGEHMYIVEKGEDRIVKCDCGHEFGDYRENWKLKSLIYVRDTEEKLDEVFFGPRKPDPGFCEVREYFCPGCGTQLEVETLPVGYPAIFDFLPDIDAFYGEWLGRPLATKKEFRDMTNDLTRKWGEELHDE